MAPRALFLARRSYRLRRLRDAALMLPLFGAFLFLLPVLRGSGDLADEVVYLFIVWPLLILAAFVLSRVLGTRRPDTEPGSGAEPGTGGEPGEGAGR